MHITIVRCTECIHLRDIDDASQIDTCDRRYANDPPALPHLLLTASTTMAAYAKSVLTIAIMLGIICGRALGAFEDVDRNIMDLNLPYDRELDNKLQLVRLLLVTPQFCYPKRNSELINSLLGLPKNIHNIGK